MTEQAYLAMRGDRVAERSICVQFVMIVAARALARNVACFFEIGDDALHGALSEPNPGCDLTESNLQLLGDASQHVGEIAEKRPVKVGCLPTQFIDHTLTLGQTGDTNYADRGSYIINCY
jgi:hypothetical protein